MYSPPQVIFHSPLRVLMGPGPSPVDPDVLNAMLQPPVGHLDPWFLAKMEEVKTMLRSVYGTTHQHTFPISGTGSAGMEACFTNIIEPGDKVFVCVNGVFGTRMAEMAKRLGAEVTVCHVPWGRTYDIENPKNRALLSGRQYKVMCFVHAETSTGALQNLCGLRELADEHGALLLVDTVTSLGGVPLCLHDLGIDVTFSGTQKCLSCPPGLAPVSFSPRAMEVIENRKTPCSSWYFDLKLLQGYWGEDRAYHHTAPINMIYGLHTALSLLLKEGLHHAWLRHEECGRLLREGLISMGLELYVHEENQMPQLTVVKIPEGVNDLEVRRELLNRFNLEIGGGLGDGKGKVWRIGLMGYGATESAVDYCLKALKYVLMNAK